MPSQAMRNKSPLRADTISSMLACSRLKKHHTAPRRLGPEALSRYPVP